MTRHLPECWKPAAVVALTAALFTPLLILGGPAFARTGAAASQYEYSSASQYQYRISICHLTRSRKHPGHTITISARAWRAHQRHGDHLGPCTGTETVRPKKHGKSEEHNGSTTTQSGTSHGKSGEQHGGGDSGGHGKP